MNYRNSAFFFFLIEASTIEHIKSETTVTHDVINITNQTILGIFFFSIFQILFENRQFISSFHLAQTQPKNSPKTTTTAKNKQKKYISYDNSL